jgi:hypothetical protein
MKMSFRPRAATAICLALLAVTPLASAEKKSSDITIDWGTAALAPGKIDPKYTPEGLTAAFRTLCQRLGYRIDHFAIDQSEFPYLVYGTIEGRRDYRDLREGLGKMPGYAYSGSTTEVARSGVTYFALNMTPASLYSRDHIGPAPREAIMHRLQSLRSSARTLRR